MASIRADIEDAIRHRRLLELVYDGGARLIEPYVLYETLDGAWLLSAYQRSGPSMSGHPEGWKRFEGRLVSNVQVLEEQFEPRSDYHLVLQEKYPIIRARV